MARTFVTASANLLRRTSGPVRTAAPLSMVAWVRPTTQTAAGTRIIAMYQSAAGAGGLFGIRLDTSGAVSAQTYDGATSQLALSTALVTAGAWNHVAGTWTGPANRSIYLNGANKVTVSTSITPTGLAETIIGAYWTTVPLQCFDGDIAEVATWSIALSDADVAALALGVSPLLVHPEALVGYWPLGGQYSPEIDLVGHADLTVTGATAGAHPRIFGLDYAQPTLAHWAAAFGATGRTLATFGPEHADPPLTGFMTHAIRNGHRVLEALAGAAEAAIFSGALPRAAYRGGRIACVLHYLAKTATSGTAGWDVSIERDNAANHDLDADAWTAVTPTPLATVDATSGKVMTATVTLTPSADLELLAAGEPFRLRVRSQAAGTATGNTQLLGVELREL